jgi:hypothetical protein
MIFPAKMRNSLREFAPVEDFIYPSLMIETRKTELFCEDCGSRRYQRTDGVWKQELENKAY